MLPVDRKPLGQLPCMGKKVYIIMARKLVFGEIEGTEEGDHFVNRKIMMPSSFHRMWARGIDGDKNIGAAAICLSGGYEDDLDSGDFV